MRPRRRTFEPLLSPLAVLVLLPLTISVRLRADPANDSHGPDVRSARRGLTAAADEVLLAPFAGIIPPTTLEHSRDSSLRTAVRYALVLGTEDEMDRLWRASLLYRSACLADEAEGCRSHAVLLEELARPRTSAPDLETARNDDPREDEEYRRRKKQPRKQDKTDSRRRKKSATGSGGSAAPDRGPDGVDVGVFDQPVAPMGKHVGLGLQLGLPTAITGKVMLGRKHGFVGGVGGGVGWTWAAALSVHADYVFHPHTLVQSDHFGLSWYFGGGAWFGLSPLHVLARRDQRELFSGFNYVHAVGLPWYGMSFGARVPFGLNLALRALPISFYAEVTPALLLFPAIGLGGGVVLGFRFYL